MSDPWFAAEVAACARRAVRHVHAPQDLADDVAAECLLILAEELRVSPDLCVDVERAERDFAAWMGTIIRHACSKALARLRPSPCPAPLLGVETTGDRLADRDRQIDLLAAIDRLNEPERSIMHLRLAGRSLTEAAYLLGLSRKRADAAYQRGLRQLERALRAYRPPPKT
ncbi:MAG TPA: sigma-70 family RNA polymerase sigma factor [Pirellulales bacterium]|nr:sigma-70 family RNA polymerase sigma factor [Pirellulales bacterium]